MGLALTDDGDISYSAETGLVKEVTGDRLSAQNALCELRCEQGLYFADETYGRSPFVWKLPTGIADKLIDTKRVVEKHLTVKTIEFTEDERILIEV